jgi:hypothetical protein
MKFFPRAKAEHKDHKDHENHKEQLNKKTRELKT